MKRKTAKIIAKEPANYVNRKVEKEEQASLVDEDKINNNKNKLSNKRKMFEEKLEQNNKAMRQIKI